jgi:uncharacterized protein (TIGR02757 family)
MTFPRNKIRPRLDITHFDRLYDDYNKRDLVHPDPLEFLYLYTRKEDREIVGLLASSLAYGRVWQILKSVQKVLDPMGDSPRAFLEDGNKKYFLDVYSDFKHRFTTGEDIALLFSGAKKALEKYGSLEKCFDSSFKISHEDVVPALENFVRELSSEFPEKSTYLLPLPSRKSACKRLHLFLRWMVRKDEVDPGGWDSIPPSKLLIPLDTHMDKICCALSFTKNKNANARAVKEITESFKKINPKDPVKYDFSLTRFGIRDELDIQKLLREYFE